MVREKQEDEIKLKALGLMSSNGMEQFQAPCVRGGRGHMGVYVGVYG